MLSITFEVLFGFGKFKIDKYLSRELCVIPSVLIRLYPEFSFCKIR